MFPHYTKELGPLAREETLRDLIQERGERFLTTLREGPIGRLIPGGAEASDAEPPPSSEPPAAAAPPPPPPPPAAAEAEKAGAKSRLSGIVESSKQTLDQWQHAVDERIRAILPGVGLFRDLEAEVKRLTSRVDELEARLQVLEAQEPSTRGEERRQE